MTAAGGLGNPALYANCPQKHLVGGRDLPIVLPGPFGCHGACARGRAGWPSCLFAICDSPWLTCLANAGALPLQVQLLSRPRHAASGVPVGTPPRTLTRLVERLHDSEAPWTPQRRASCAIPQRELNCSGCAGGAGLCAGSRLQPSVHCKGARVESRRAGNSFPLSRAGLFALIPSLPCPCQLLDHLAPFCRPDRRVWFSFVWSPPPSGWCAL